MSGLVLVAGEGRMGLADEEREFCNDGGGELRGARFGGQRQRQARFRPGFKRLRDLDAIRQRATEADLVTVPQLAWHLADRDAVERRPVLAPQVRQVE